MKTGRDNCSEAYFNIYDNDSKCVGSYRVMQDFCVLANTCLAPLLLSNKWTACSAPFLGAKTSSRINLVQFSHVLNLWPFILPTQLFRRANKKKQPLPSACPCAAALVMSAWCVCLTLNFCLCMMRLERGRKKKEITCTAEVMEWFLSGLFERIMLTADSRALIRNLF